MVLVFLYGTSVALRAEENFTLSVTAISDWGEPIWHGFDEGDDVGIQHVSNLSYLEGPLASASAEMTQVALPELTLPQEKGKTAVAGKKSDSLNAGCGEAAKESGAEAIGDAVFKAEIKILEKLWNISFEMDMKENNNTRNTFHFGTFARLRTPGKKIEIDLDYSREKEDSEEPANRFVLDSRQEWYFNASRWSPYLHNTVKYDKGKEFDTQMEANAGLGYALFSGPISQVKFRVGAGVSREFGRMDEELAPDPLYGLVLKQQITSWHRVSTVLDYFPEWNDLSSYRLKARANWKILFDTESDLSLNIGASNRYDSETPLREFEEGVDYNTTLMWAY